MKIRTLFASLPPLLVGTTLFGASPLPDSGRLQIAVNAREQRVELLKQELKAQDDRIEARIDSLVDMLKFIGDSKDSRTKVARMKRQTMDALAQNLDYFRRKNSVLVEELRRPTMRLTDEQKRTGIEFFEARIEKRINQIIALQQSLPTHQDYDRYNVQPGGSDWGSTFTVNEDYKQNARLVSHTNAQRTKLIASLHESIASLDRQNRSLKAQAAPAAEIAKNESLLTERQNQLAAVLLPESAPTRQIGRKEAIDLDKHLQAAIADLRSEFTSLFARYQELIGEMQALNAGRS